MDRALGEISLKTGERVEATVARAPAPEWAGRLERLLSEFEIGPWRPALGPLLHQEVGAEIRIYSLHRSGEPFATMMTVEDHGVGVRGNVWTQPAERRTGACAGLMELQMGDFQSRGGRGLYLFTDYRSVPYRIYQSFGFQSVEPQSGHMAFHSSSESDFEHSYFQPGPTTVETFGWGHLPAAHPLFMGGTGLLRCASLGLVGRWSPEWPLVGLLLEEGRRPGGVRSRVLRSVATGAVVGFATWTRLRGARSTRLVDLHCHSGSLDSGLGHSSFWGDAESLFEALDLRGAGRIAVYADTENAQKIRFLEGAGFELTRVLRKVPVDWCRPEMGFLPRTTGGALAARIASPLWMSLRKRKPRQGGTANASPARMDLAVYERAG